MSFREPSIANGHYAGDVLASDLAEGQSNPPARREIARNDMLLRAEFILSQSHERSEGTAKDASP